MRGLVIKNTGSWYQVKTEDGKLVDCKIKCNFRLKGIRSTNPIAVGDYVQIIVNNEGTAFISEIEDRKNYIIRRASNLSKQSHILAANLDQCMLIITINYPETSTIFIDRFLATAEAYRIPVKLIFNKIDRYNEDDTRYMDALIDLYTYIGYPCFKVSALNEVGINEIKQDLEGKVTLLSGNSGVGKSTMINLLMRLYDVNDGQILIDGVDIRDYDKNSLHSQLGVVLQETFLFAGSILNNIRYSNPSASYEEVIKAAKIANAHDFISRLPDGYDTYIGSKGFNLSGGERQRIAIARAVLANPKILILDEATSSVDTRTEELIQAAMDKLTEGRTSFVIAHRLSTIRDADMILVMRDGDIVERGTHDELLARNGFYADIYNAQFTLAQ